MNLFRYPKLKLTASTLLEKGDVGYTAAQESGVAGIRCFLSEM